MTLRHLACSIFAVAGMIVANDEIVRRVVCISRVASRWPGQRLRPPPHGAHEDASADSSRKRSGIKVSGRVNSDGS